MNLLPDLSFFAQLVLFLMSMFILRWLVFKHIVALIEARREATSGKREKAIAAEIEANILEKERISVIKDARAGADTYRNGLIAASIVKADAIVAEARKMAVERAEMAVQRNRLLAKELEMRLSKAEEEITDFVSEQAIYYNAE